MASRSASRWRLQSQIAAIEATAGPFLDRTLKRYEPLLPPVGLRHLRRTVLHELDQPYFDKPFLLFLGDGPAAAAHPPPDLLADTAIPLKRLRDLERFERLWKEEGDAPPETAEKMRTMVMEGALEEAATRVLAGEAELAADTPDELTYDVLSESWRRFPMRESCYTVHPGGTDAATCAAELTGFIDRSFAYLCATILTVIELLPLPERASPAMLPFASGVQAFRRVRRFFDRRDAELFGRYYVLDADMHALCKRLGKPFDEERAEHAAFLDRLGPALERAARELGLPFPDDEAGRTMAKCVLVLGRGPAPANAGGKRRGSA